MPSMSFIQQRSGQRTVQQGSSQPAVTREHVLSLNGGREVALEDGREHVLSLGVFRALLKKPLQWWGAQVYAVDVEIPTVIGVLKVSRQTTLERLKNSAPRNLRVQITTERFESNPNPTEAIKIKIIDRFHGQ